jgi:hypothetical protein
VKFTMEGLVTPSAEALPGGVRVRIVEVQQVEHHLRQGDEPPEGWTVLEDGLAARGPEHVLSAVFEVSLPVQSIRAFIQELSAAVDEATRLAIAVEQAEAGNGVIVPKLELPPGIDLRGRGIGRTPLD